MSRYTVADQILTILQGRTQAQAAALLGVSSRTIRYWKNEGVMPSRLGNDKKLRHASAGVRTRIRQRARKDEFPYEEPNLSVPPRGERRELDVRDQTGRPSGIKYRSDWVNYDVRLWDNRRIHDLLKWGRDHNKIVQFIYLIPVGSKYEDSRGRIHEYKGKRAIHGGTVPRLLTGYTDMELWETIENITRHDLGGKRHLILYVGFLEPGRSGRASRAPYKSRLTK